ncbi:helix-turn-helix domain-containing protein [Aeromicrobium sp. UC242_57]|uniref:helix-turn-helix domain-containing protein n=1 Tax=Aeromicrobium sp. UC242_57 TaxID=3374624 RepID=UPI0037983486
MTERVEGRASTEVRSVARASRLLIAVASGETDGSGKALAEALGLAVPTAHHILSTLVAEGLLAKSESSRYYVGPRAAIVAEAHLRATAAPAYLDEPLRKLVERDGGDDVPRRVAK